MQCDQRIYHVPKTATVTEIQILSENQIRVCVDTVMGRLVMAHHRWCNFTFCFVEELMQKLDKLYANTYNGFVTLITIVIGLVRCIMKCT